MTDTAIKRANRFGWVEYAKGFAIFFVVYRHVIGGYEESGFVLPDFIYTLQQSIYNIRMPLFFIIAGIFARKSLQKRTLKQFVQYKAGTILYPYFVWITIQLLIQTLFSQYAHAQRDISDFLYIFYNPFALKDQFWFLFILFIISVSFGMIQYKWSVTPWQQLLLGIILNYASTLTDIIQLEVACYYYLFFALGDFVSDFLHRKHHLLGSWYYTVLLLPVFLFTQWYWLAHPELKDTNLYVFDLIAIVGSAFIFSLAFVLDKLSILKFIRTIGKHSLYIYIMHVIIQGAIRALLVNVLHLQNLYILITISLMIATVLPIYIYQWSMKWHMGFLYRFKESDTPQNQRQVVTNSAL